MGKWTWEPFKHVDPNSETCHCGNPADVNGECGACFSASEQQLNRVENAKAVVYRTDTGPVVTIGGAQFAFSDQPQNTPRARPAADPRRQHRRAETRNIPARRAWRPTNGNLVRVAIVAAAGILIVIDWALAASVLGLLAVVMWLHRWSRRGQRARQSGDGHLATVSTDGLPVSTTAGWVRR